MTETFAEAVSGARKALGLSQRELAGSIKKEDGAPISTTYLNDIEHGRRKPSKQLVHQFAEVLRIERDYLFHLLGIVPHDLLKKKVSKGKVLSAYEAFRRELEK